MKIKFNIFLVVLTILFLSGCVQDNKYIQDFKICLEEQKETFWIRGFEGEPIRLTNKCETFVEKTSNTEAIILLADSKDYPTLLGLLRNTLTPKEVIVKIYDRQGIQRGWRGNMDIAIAENPNTPKDVLIRILKEKTYTNTVLHFGNNIIKIENEILELEDYYTNAPGPPERYFWEELLRHLATNQYTSEGVLKMIIGKNYPIFIEGNKTLSQKAQENLNSKK